MAFYYTIQLFENFEQLPLLLRSKGGEHMTIYDLIDDDTRQLLNAKKPVVHRPKRNKEKLSDADLRDLMGTNRQIHKKVNGKVKRK